MKAFIKQNELKSFFKDGMSVLVGGFLANGAPELLIDALKESKVKDLTVICNDGGFPDRGHPLDTLGRRVDGTRSATPGLPGRGHSPAAPT